MLAGSQANSETLVPARIYDQFTLQLRKQAQGSKGVLPEAPDQGPEWSLVSVTGPLQPGAFSRFEGWGGWHVL